MAAFECLGRPGGTFFRGFLRASHQGERPRVLQGGAHGDLLALRWPRADAETLERGETALVSGRVGDWKKGVNCEAPVWDMSLPWTARGHLLFQD